LFGSEQGVEMISALDVKSELRRRLEAAGLWESLDLRESQFLDLSPQVFVELVLYDAGVLGKVTDIANDVRLAHPDDEIDVVIRAHWQVRSVLYAGYAVGLSGGVREAERFDIVISSGSVSQSIVVDVTKAAIDLLASRLHATAPGPLTHRQVEANLVRGYVELQLSQGGTSYWDPIRFPQLDINASAVEYMIGHQLFKVGA
jgi:hypothetical protein